MPRVTLSPSAVSTLKEIWEWSSEQWGEMQADRYNGLLEQGFEKLASHQILADKPAQRLVPSAPEGLSYHRVEKHYIFFDRPEPDHVRIYYVLHTARQNELERLLSQFDRSTPQPNWIEDAMDQGNAQADPAKDHEEDHSQ